MAIVQETERETRLIALTDWPNHHPWPSVAGLRHWVFHSATNGFDAVVLNTTAAGGTRWSPSPRLLQEIRRVLRPDGCIYLGADNRLGLARGRSAGARTYSRFGYRRLLRRAGFESVRFCEALRRPVGSRRDSWRRRLKKRLQGHKWFGPSFNILAAVLRCILVADHAVRVLFADGLCNASFASNRENDMETACAFYTS